MAEFKLNIGVPKHKKSTKKEVKDSEADVFLGKMIGDKVSGESFGLSGYEFEITGGSDHTGIPMRKDVIGVQRKRILIVSGVGIRKNRAGRKKRRMLAGNTVHESTAQINLKVLKEGKTSLFEEEKAAEAPKEEEKKVETPKEEKKTEEKPKESPKKEEPQKEEKPKETPVEKKTEESSKAEEKPKVEEKPKEEKKPEAPKEEKPAEEKKD